jgi:putative oxidoreductase
MRFGMALLRAVVGGLFMGHGLQKLTGWFDGHGLEATGQGFESMGLAPGKVHAGLAGAAETGGGALLAAGLATPVAGTLLSGTMITAIRKVHLANGPWASNGGYEYNLVLLAIIFAIVDVGPGPLSFDEAPAGKRRAGLGWAIAQLAAGAAGSIAAVELGSRAKASKEATSSDAAAESAAASAGEGSSNGASAPTETPASQTD